VEDFETLGCADCLEVELSAGRARCKLRDALLGSLSRTFCANHPEVDGPPVAVPLGPIVMRTEEDLEVVRESPDMRGIRNRLLTMVEESGAVSVEDLSPREEVALWQLARWREGRATVLLEGIGGEAMLPWTRPCPPAEQDLDPLSPPGPPPRSLVGRTRAVVILMVLNVLLALVAIGSDVMQLDLLDRAETTGVTVEEADANDARQSAIAVLQALVFLVTAVAFWMWQYRAYANLRLLGAPRVKHSPGFAIGAWFIPFANLVYPYRVMLEIGEKSGGDASRSMKGWILLWWLAYLAMGVAEQIASGMMESETAIEGLRRATHASIVGESPTILSAGLAIVVVREIRRRQGRHVDIVPVFD